MKPDPANLTYFCFRFVVRMAMSHQHRCCCCCRDVKPGNVLIWGCREVDREGHDSVSSTAAPQQRQQQQAGQATAPTPTHTSISGRKSVLKMLEVKLTDYGTVRRMDNRDLTVGQGTKAFMAPEVEVQVRACVCDLWTWRRFCDAHCDGDHEAREHDRLYCVRVALALHHRHPIVPMLLHHLVQTGTGRNAKPIGSYDTSVDVFSAG